MVPQKLFGQVCKSNCRWQWHASFGTGKHDHKFGTV